MPKSTQVLNDERHERHLLRLRGIAERREEDARRLVRYDEAIRLLREAAPAMDLISFELSERVDAFLDAEPKEPPRFALEEITPAEVNRRYRSSMKAKPKGSE